MLPRWNWQYNSDKKAGPRRILTALRISDMMNCLVVQRNGDRGVVLSHPGEYGD